jgi:hypothetical protein
MEVMGWATQNYLGSCYTPLKPKLHLSGDDVSERTLDSKPDRQIRSVANGRVGDEISFRRHISWSEAMP